MVVAPTVPVLLLFNAHSWTLRWIVKIWTGAVMFCLKFIVGLDYRQVGRDNVPDGPCIIACNHQSLWETVAFCHLFPDASIVAKSEQGPEGGEKKRKKRAHDPNAPKRPLTPYFLYMQSARQIIAGDLGEGAKPGQISEEGTRRWKAMEEEEKKVRLRPTGRQGLRPITDNLSADVEDCLRKQPGSLP